MLQVPHLTQNLSSFLLPFFILFLRTYLSLPEQIGIDKRLQVTIEDAINITDLTVCPVVFNHSIGLQDIGTDLTAPAYLLFLTT